MTDNMTVGHAGLLIFGTNAPHSRSLLKKACDNQGWARIVSRPPSKHWALQTAVTDVAKGICPQRGTALSVRALSQELAFEATRIERGTLHNVVTPLVSVQLEDATNVVTVLESHASAPANLTTLLQQGYDNVYGMLSSSQVLRAVQSAIDKLGGVMLGGRNVYYLPISMKSDWDSFRADACLWKYHSSEMIVATNPETVAHVVDQLTTEVTTASNELLEKIAAGDLTPEASKRLARQAKELVEKVKRYEESFQQEMAFLRQPLENAMQALSVSSLLSVSV